MKKFLPYLVILIISLLLTSVGFTQTTKPRVLAVIMGISKYQNVPSLQYADRDAVSFYRYLLSPAGGKADTNDIRLLLNEKATSYNFFESMDRLLDMAKESDVCYIYFAGHGDIEKKTERQNGFLIGYNAPANCYAAGGSIGVRYLQDYVETLISKNKSKVILIVDACRSGKLAGGSEGAEITALALKQEWKGVTKILSCQPGEKSLEGENWGGGAGVFTYFMLKGLNGQADEDNDGNVSLRELSYFLDKNVPKETGNKQMPDVVGDKRFEIARVDKETFLAMQRAKESKDEYAMSNSSAGFETDLAAVRDGSVIKAYQKFKEYIKNENLIDYNDEEAKKETALSIYRSLEKNRKAESIITTMKGELLAALQNKAQISLNNWMNGIRTDSLTKDQTHQELNSAFNMIDSAYSQYNQIRFKYLLWSSFKEKDEQIKIKLLDECMKINPNDPTVNRDLSIIYDNLKNYEQAYKYINKATEVAKNWGWAWNSKGFILGELGKNEEAIYCYDKAIGIKADHALAWLNKGKCFSKLGKPEEAIKCFEKVLEIKSDNYIVLGAWYSKGLELARLGKHEEAIKCYDKAIEISSNYFVAWIDKGTSLRNLGKYDEAIKCYNKAIEIKPDFPLVWNNKGYALEALNKTEEAIKCYDKAIELEPDFFVAWGNKGNVFFASKKYDEAIKCYDKVIEIKPVNIDAWYNKACSYALLRNKVEMLKSLKRAIELNPQFKADAKKDEDFKEYWDDPEFKKLVE